MRCTPSIARRDCYSLARSPHWVPAAERLDVRAARAVRPRREARLGERLGRHGPAHEGRRALGEAEGAGRRGARLPRRRSARRADGRPDERRTGRRLAHLPVDRRRNDLEARAHQPGQGRLLRRDRVLGRAERRRHRRPGQPPLRRAHHARRRPDLGEARGPRPAADVHGRGRLCGERHVPDRRQGLPVRLVRHRRRAGLARLPHEQSRPGLELLDQPDPGRQRVVGALLGRVSGRRSAASSPAATTSSRSSPA